MELPLPSHAIKLSLPCSTFESVSLRSYDKVISGTTHGGEYGQADGYEVDELTGPGTVLLE